MSSSFEVRASSENRKDSHVDELYESERTDPSQQKSLWEVKREEREDVDELT